MGDTSHQLVTFWHLRKCRVLRGNTDTVPKPGAVVLPASLTSQGSLIVASKLFEFPNRSPVSRFQRDSDCSSLCLLPEGVPVADWRGVC